MIILITICIVCLSAILALPLLVIIGKINTDYDRTEEDEAQTRYLQEWIKTHPNKQ